MVASVLTERDEQVVVALACHVRLFTATQIAAAWWNATETGVANARRRLRELRALELIEMSHVFAQLPPPLDSPVFTWLPGQPAPDAEAVSWKLQSRWSEPPRRTTVYLATRRAANRYGGRQRGRIAKPEQATHDLGMSQVYLHYLDTQQDAIADWLGEDVFAPERQGEKLPDAVLRNNDGQVYRVIEFGGAYDATRVEAFHDDNEERGLPYELW